MRFVAACAVLACAGGIAGTAANKPAKTFDAVIRQNGERMIETGRQIFRFDTFGDDAFWGDALKLHQAIEGERFGGIGPGVSPSTALAVGLKLDAEALSPDVLNAIRHGDVNLNDPAVTLALLDANAVVGSAPIATIPAASDQSAFNAPCAIRPSIIRSRLASAADSTAGRIGISMSVPSLRSPRT